ncbi:CMP-N-acetylneuraminic acid synthetase [bacterium]|nr:CMP-N-acetylneuraminic acid synthetase [bacterium]
MRLFKGVGGITQKSKPLVIAEACENHLGNIDIAIKMIEESSKAGADAVKFQHHLREHEMIRGLAMSANFDEDLYDFLGRCSLKINDHIRLKKCCDSLGIKYLCTPFCKEAAVELLDYNLIDTAKIGSGELLDFRLLDYLISSQIPLILSTGMSTIEEIQSAYDFLKSKDSDFCFLHCVSEYPPNPKDICLDTITFLRERFVDLIIGFSCHTPDIYTAFAAITLGANIVEKHVILDKNVSCPDQSVSIEFTQLKQLVDGINAIHSGRGFRRNVFENELEIKSWARRILVAKHDIGVGEKLSQDNLTTLRAGNGISSEYYFHFLGKTVISDIYSGMIISKQMLKDE